MAWRHYKFNNQLISNYPITSTWRGPKSHLSFNSPVSLYRYTHSCQCTERGSKQKLILNVDLEVHSSRDGWLELPPDTTKKQEFFWLASVWVTWLNDCHGVAMVSEFWLDFGPGLELGGFFWSGAKFKSDARSSQVLTVWHLSLAKLLSNCYCMITSSTRS